MSVNIATSIKRSTPAHNPDIRNAYGIPMMPAPGECWSETENCKDEHEHKMCTKLSEMYTQVYSISSYYEVGITHLQLN